MYNRIVNSEFKGFEVLEETILGKIPLGSNISSLSVFGETEEAEYGRYVIPLVIGDGNYNCYPRDLSSVLGGTNNRCG
jgi:hypothetical protein